MSIPKKLKKQIIDIIIEFLKNKEDFQHDRKKLGLFSLKLKNCVIDVLQKIEVPKKNFEERIRKLKYSKMQKKIQCSIKKIKITLKTK